MNGVVVGGVLSLVWLVVGALPFSLLTKNAPLAQLPISTAWFALGLVVAVPAVVIGWFDLKGIRVGRLNPERRTGTLVGLWLSGIAVVLHWAVIGVVIYRLF